MLRCHLLEVAARRDDDPIATQHESAVHPRKLADCSACGSVQHATIVLRVALERIDDDLVRAGEDGIVVAERDEEADRLAFLALAAELDAQREYGIKYSWVCNFSEYGQRRVELAVHKVLLVVQLDNGHGIQLDAAVRHVARDD